MPYAKALRTIRIDLGEVAGEPGYWIEVEHPEAMTWRTKRAIIRAGNGETDDIARSSAQVAAMVCGWNLEDVDTGEALALPATEASFDRLPSHIVEGLMSAVGNLFQIPKESGS